MAKKTKASQRSVAQKGDRRTRENIQVQPRPMSPATSKLLSVVAVAVGVIGAIIIWNKTVTINGFDSFPIDDSWIHLTFARTLKEWGQFAYGPRNHITSGSTSPLFTFLESL